MQSCDAQCIEASLNLVRLIFISKPLGFARHFARNSSCYKIGKRSAPRRFKVAKTCLEFRKRGRPQTRHLMKRNPVLQFIHAANNGLTGCPNANRDGTNTANSGAPTTVIARRYDVAITVHGQSVTYWNDQSLRIERDGEGARGWVDCS